MHNPSKISMSSKVNYSGTVKDVCTQADDGDKKQLSLVILELKKVIEEDPKVFRDFHAMFDQVHSDPDPNQPPVTNYVQLLAALDKAITTAPTYSSTGSLMSSVPMYGVLTPFYNTQAGYHAFTNPKVNAIFHKIFEQWTRFLASPASCSVLVSTEGGWFSPDVLQTHDDHLGMPFADAWVCSPDQPHMGFKSWDDFFGRRFKEGVRPTLTPHDPELINAACETTTCRVTTGVQATHEFWLKGMPYSLSRIFDVDPLTSQFVGGTVFQGTLSPLDYHRWHSPVDGRVVKTRVVPGTHYPARPDDGADPDVVSRSQEFVTALSTRALVFIESDNPRVGLMCFVGVGLGELSTTEVGVKEGDLIKKGDEIGSFHFGGSAHLLIFRPETSLTLLTGSEDQNITKVGTELFSVLS